MTVVFEWDDSAERSGLNRVSVASTDGMGGALIQVSHADHTSVVGLPRYAVEGMRDALTEHLEDTTPDAVVLDALNRHHPGVVPASNEALAKRVTEALREFGFLAPRP